MLSIDPKSFIVISAAFGLLCAFTFFALRSGFPKDIKGLATWAWSCVAFAMAALLFTSRQLPPFSSSFLPNLLVASGVVGMNLSLRQFCGLKLHAIRWAMLLAVVVAALGVATFLYDDHRQRLLIMSGALTILFSGGAFTVFRLGFKGIAEYFTGLVFIATAGVMLIRCVVAFSQTWQSTTRLEMDSSVVHQVYMSTFSFSLVALSVGFLMMVNRALHRKLESLAVQDQLTGAYRRDAFLALVEKEVERSGSQNRSLSLLMIDLDNFKKINDRHGHLIGDRVIHDFSKKVRSILRRQDIVGRYGGEEFLVVLPDTPIENARAIAGRILAIAAQNEREDVPPYTVSIGVSMLEATRCDVTSIIDAADKAMYAAKASGKNRVEVFSIG